MIKKETGDGGMDPAVSALFFLRCDWIKMDRVQTALLWRTTP